MKGSLKSLCSNGPFLVLFFPRPSFLHFMAGYGAHRHAVQGLRSHHDQCEGFCWFNSSTVDFFHFFKNVRSMRKWCFFNSPNGIYLLCNGTGVQVLLRRSVACIFVNKEYERGFECFCPSAPPDAGVWGVVRVSAYAHLWVCVCAFGWVCGSDMHASQMHIISSPSQKPVFVRSPVNTQHTVPGQLKGSIPAFGYCAHCEFPFLFSVKNCPSPPMDKIKAIYC